jgi:hypothetical protein
LDSSKDATGMNELTETTISATNLTIGSATVR